MTSIVTLMCSAGSVTDLIDLLIINHSTSIPRGLPREPYLESLKTTLVFKSNKAYGESTFRAFTSYVKIPRRLAAGLFIKII
jgi:hypothetical protein